jgi:16S rRNA (adenine1518-N6/adenine1519-N6)-dimethyltransferase
MPIYKPTELMQFLDELGINPKKRLSQNFLIDGNIIRKIVREAQLQPGDPVIEIGPGPGSLTEALLSTEARVLAVEKDAVLAQALERLKNPSNHLDVFCEDILSFSLEEHLKSDKKAQVIANLPYNITTPILIKLVPMHRWIKRIIVMVQEEVARRMTAKPGTKEYGSLTVFLNFYANVHYAFGVSGHCFFPVPDVQSAVVTLDLKEPPLVEDEAQFFKMTRTAFEHRRKMLRGSLRDLYPPAAIEAGLTMLQKSPLARPEELSTEEFLILFNHLKP